MGDPLVTLRRSGEQGGGRHHPSVTPLNDQAGSLGTKEKVSLPDYPLIIFRF
jgi:hypothetical protein